MLIKKLNLNYFGRFQNQEIELKPGVNLLYGENESGKSTIHTFIKGMLFGIERLRGRGAATKEDLYTRYLPWDYPGAYRGQMDIQTGNKEYRLQRSFHANDKSFTILDLDTGREIKLGEGLISELIPGLNESAYKNTISIEQLKAQTDIELASQVRNYITNLSIAKSKEVNVTKAVTSLTEKKKVLESSLSNPEIKKLQADIDEGLSKEDKLEALAARHQELLAEEQRLNAAREAAIAVDSQEINSRMEQLPAILEKYRSYMDCTGQKKSIEDQMEEWETKLGQWELESSRADAIKADLKEAARLSSELPQKQNARIALIKRCETSLKVKTRRNFIISLIPALITAILNYILIRDAQIKLGVSVGTLIAGGVLLVILTFQTNLRKKEYDLEAESLAKELSEIDVRLQCIYQNNKVNSLQELSTKLEDLLKSSYVLVHGKEQLIQLENRKEELEDKCDLLQEEIMKYIQYFTAEEELNDESIRRLQLSVREKKQEMTGRQMEQDQRLKECQNSINKLRWEIASLEGNEEQLLRNRQRLDYLMQKQKEEVLELEAVKLALNTIQALSVDIHDSFGQKLNQEVSKIISKVTNDKYQDLKLDEKLEVKVGWNGDYRMLDRLSAGTIDQIYFALRLAVAGLLMGEEEMPFLLDDSFALYDEKRIRSAIRMLAEHSQVLLFSCHRREQAILEELGIPYHFVDLNKEIAMDC